MENRRELLEELVRLGDELSYVFWYGWFLPIDHKREEEILRKMKEVVDKLI